MKICIITDVPLGIEHGMGRYITNLSNSLGIDGKSIFNLFTLNDDIISYINSEFDIVSIQIGILKLSQINNLKFLQQIRLKKIATIHSVVDKEIELYLECMRIYFKKVDVGVNTLYGDEYQQQFLDIMDGFVFYTYNDSVVFNQYYKSDKPQYIIPPSIEYCFDVYSNRVKKNNNISVLGRIDYRKGVIASFSSMGFLQQYNLDVYGLIMNEHDGLILNHFLNKNRNIVYKGTLSDKLYYFDRTSIFLGNSLYEPFGFSHIENLFNFVVPIIGKDTGTHEAFGADYPFVVEDSVPQLVEMVKQIERMNGGELYEILKRTQNNLIHLTDEYFRQKYLEMIKSIM
jgi:glycosyltransferase involved in cell wall biosynthesis